MSAVPSLLPESTTRISSAKDAESMAAAMCAASLSVMIVTDSFGTHRILLCRTGRRAGRARRAASPRGPNRRRSRRCTRRGADGGRRGRGAGGCDRPRAAGDRRELNRLEIDERPVVVENRAQLVIARLREVALRLEDEEVRRRAGRQLLLLGVEALRGELAGRAVA